MSLFSSLNIAATGLTAHRQWMDLIAGNVANANTTRTPEGGPFQRQLAYFRDIVDTDGNVLGVQVAGVGKDTAPPRLVYEPGHPDANAEGYVAYPNVNIMIEMVDLIAASRAYEANISSFQAAKDMAQATLSILT
jgi:flagellar basal-body rod protein FlgC